MSDIDTHDSDNYDLLSPEFEAALIGWLLVNAGFDAEHQGDGTILFSDEAVPGQKVRYRMTVEYE